MSQESRVLSQESRVIIMRIRTKEEDEDEEEVENEPSIVPWRFIMRIRTMITPMVIINR